MKWYRNIKDVILSFFYPYGKIFLVSFPNSGRSWLIYMLRKILNDSKIDNLNIEPTHDGSEIIIENGTRLDPNLLFKYTSRWRYSRSRVIFLSRDPRDIIASNFYQVTNRAKNPFKFNSKSDFIRSDIYGFKRVIHFFNIWFKQKNIPIDFLLVKYESLLKDTDDLKRIFRFLKISVSDELIDKVYQASSANKMRVMEQNNTLEGFSDFGKEINKLKVRKAVSGSYLSELNKNDIEFCNVEMKNLSTYFDY